MKIVTLGEACETIMGQAPAGDTYNVVGTGLPLIAGASDFGDYFPKPSRSTTAATKTCREGDIVLCVRATIGDLNWADRPYCLGRGVAALRARDGVADSRYIWRAVEAHVELLRALGRGATFKQITRSDVVGFSIPLPPLPEQKRIAAILDQADDLRRRRWQALQRAEALNQSYFDDQFSNRIGDQNSEGCLADLVDRKRGISYGIVQRGDDVEDGVPVVRIGDFVSGKFKNREFKRTSARISQTYKRTVLSGGELLISIRGTVGRLAIAPNSIAGANVSREVAVIPLLPEISRDVILAFLRNGIVQKRITADVRGVAQSGINLEHLRALRVPKFSEDEVKAFELEATHCRAIENAHNAARQNTETLFTSLQHRAFRGDL
ncbi:restriction endonuclease subunit S [Sphingomonadaceae bacterium OTU29LAMAA1]|nr:restriction endonuclease subunit S [Sphingomonadaceae bacterium OTU29LAMAA1]